MFYVNIDMTGLAALGQELEGAMKSAMLDAGRELSAQAHARAVELANAKLNSRRQMFIDGLHMKEEDGVFILSLDAKVSWIDDGMPRHNMIEDLLKSPHAKRAKDGSKYMVIPFNHGPGKGPTNTPASTLDLVGTVKAEMKSRKIPFAKIERDDQGRPKTGMLHRFNIDNSPTKTGGGPGQGWGPVGAVKQGPNMRQKVGGGPGGGGIPFLRGVAVYQHAMDGGGVKRSIMTFRIVSSKMESPRWDYPGVEPTNIFAETAKWCDEQVDKMIPQIIDSVTSKV